MCRVNEFVQFKARILPVNRLIVYTLQSTMFFFSCELPAGVQ